MTQAGKETIYTKEFQKSFENSNQPEWLKDLRKKAFDLFTENGIPTTRDEEWKYTSLNKIVKRDFDFSS